MWTTITNFFSNFEVEPHTIVAIVFAAAAIALLILMLKDEHWSVRRVWKKL